MLSHVFALLATLVLACSAVDKIEMPRCEGSSAADCLYRSEPISFTVSSTQSKTFYVDTAGFLLNDNPALSFQIYNQSSSTGSSLVQLYVRRANAPDINNYNNHGNNTCSSSVCTYSTSSGPAIVQCSPKKDATYYFWVTTLNTDVTIAGRIVIANDGNAAGCALAEAILGTLVIVLIVVGVICGLALLGGVVLCCCGTAAVCAACGRKSHREGHVYTKIDGHSPHGAAPTPYYGAPQGAPQGGYQQPPPGYQQPPPAQGYQQPPPAQGNLYPNLSQSPPPQQNA